MPEFLGALRHVWCVEVFHQRNAEQPRGADRHIGVGGKVAVDLQGIRHCGERQLQTGKLRRISVCSVDQNRQIICEQHLLDRALDEPFGGKAHIVRSCAARLLDLREQVLRALDRAGQDCRKEGGEQRKIEEIALGFTTAVHVDHIAADDERVERNADRQSKLRQTELHTGAAEQLSEKAEVFE